MYALLSAGWVLPSLVAPAFAGIVTDHVGWKWVFLGIIPLAVTVGAIAQPADARLRTCRRPTSLPSLGALPTRSEQPRGVGALVIGLQADHLIVIAGSSVGGVPLAVPMLRRLLPTGFFRARNGLSAVLACRVHGHRDVPGRRQLRAARRRPDPRCNRGRAGFRDRRRGNRVDGRTGDHVQAAQTCRRGHPCAWASAC